MNLREVNKLWKEYKKRHGMDNNLLIEEVVFDAPEEVEAFFDLIELLAGKRILHMTRRAHIYRSEFIKFILTHEFTHLYDFINCPFDIEDHERLFLYMNSYSEFHACKVTLEMLIKDLSNDDKVYVNKNQIPGPFKDISIRRLMEESLYRTKLAYDTFYVITIPHHFVNSFRQLMYLYGYISILKNDMDTLERTLRVLRIDDGNYIFLYRALKEEDVDGILEYAKKVYHGAFLYFIKSFIRRNYDPDLYSDEELEGLDETNAQEFIEELNKRVGTLDQVPKDPKESFLQDSIKYARFFDVTVDSGLCRW